MGTQRQDGLRVAAVVLVFTRGYERLLVPVEGRRWMVELATAFVAVAVVLAVADAGQVIPKFVAVVLVTLGIVGTRRVGNAVANARDWYDRDAYYRQNEI